MCGLEILCYFFRCSVTITGFPLLLCQCIGQWYGAEIKNILFQRTAKFSSEPRLSVTYNHLIRKYFDVQYKEIGLA